MLVDQTSLLIAVGFSGAALMMALLIGWLNSRRDAYLFYWAIGMALVVAATATIGLQAKDAASYMLAYMLILAGLVSIHAGALHFRHGKARTRQWLPLLLIGEAMIAVPFMLGWSGIGTIGLNASSAVMMMLSAWQYWSGREEAPLALTANSLLYALTGVSFLACAAVLAAEGQWVVNGVPDNWAENFNSIMAIIGLTGCGALSLTLNQTRTARRHRLDANTDSLTGVMNRRALFDRYEAADLMQGTAVLMFDLDHFKQINDHRGHAAGDRVLQHFASLLRSNVRGDDTVARLGGEEFCAVLVSGSREEAEAVAERIRLCFEQAAIPTGKGDDTATVSIGVAVNSPTEAFSSVLSRADAALYKAKRSGRNQIRAAALRLVA